MDEAALREWGIGFLLLGGVLLVFSLAFAIGEFLVAEVSSRNSPFAAYARYGIGLGIVLLAAGAGLWFRTNPRPASEAPRVP